MAEFIVTGVRSIDKKLKHLERRAANRVARGALSKGASIGAKAVKKQIPSLQKSARKSIGHSTKKSSATGITESKFGTTGKRTGSTKRNKSHSGGVGLSKWDIHWFLLGTKKRFHKSGKGVGKMPKSDAVPKGAMAARSEIKAGMIARAKTLLAKELAKLGS